MGVIERAGAHLDGGESASAGNHTVAGEANLVVVEGVGGVSGRSIKDETQGFAATDACGVDFEIADIEAGYGINNADGELIHPSSSIATEIDFSCI